MYRIAETGHTVSITKEKFLNTYPPLFSPLPVGFVQQAGDFLYNRKLRSLLYKNASRGSHWVGKENAASATRRRRRILLAGFFLEFRSFYMMMNSVL